MRQNLFSISCRVSHLVFSKLSVHHLKLLWKHPVPNNNDLTIKPRLAFCPLYDDWGHKNFCNNSENLLGKDCETFKKNKTFTKDFSVWKTQILVYFKRNRKGYKEMQIDMKHFLGKPSWYWSIFSELMDIFFCTWHQSYLSRKSCCDSSFYTVSKASFQGYFLVLFIQIFFFCLCFLLCLRVKIVVPCLFPIYRCKGIQRLGVSKGPQQQKMGCNRLSTHLKTKEI